MMVRMTTDVTMSPAPAAAPARLPAAPVARDIMHLVISVGGRLDAELLHKAVRLTLDAEPVLGSRFVNHWLHPSWRRREDLDELPYFEIRETKNPEDELREALAGHLTSLPFQVLLVREESDQVCIKLEHRLGDGAALTQVGYLLADIYTRLRNDPRYRPVPRVDWQPSIRPVSSLFSPRQRIDLLRAAFRMFRRLGPTGHWILPPFEGAVSPKDFVIRRLDPERVRRVGAFAYQRRATAYQVLLAAFFLALCDLVPHSGDRPLRMLCPVDLRRYLGAAANPPICNLTGFAPLTLSPSPAPTLDDALGQIRDQFEAQWREKHLGLLFSEVPFDIPVVKHVKRLAGYLGRETAAGRRQVRRDDTRRAIAANQGGELSEAKMRFGDVRATDVWGIGGVHNPRFWGLTATTFAGSMTVCIGRGPSALVHGILERMLDRLPG